MTQPKPGTPEKNEALRTFLRRQGISPAYPPESSEVVLAILKNQVREFGANPTAIIRSALKQKGA